MRLKKAQKEEVLKLIAEGLESDEINECAALFDPAFEVSRQQIDYYRKTRKIDIEDIIQKAEHKALNTGLALKSKRVERLKALAEELEKDLMERNLLWTDDVKGVGSGPIAEIVEFEEFNKAEVDAYRGVLDDIAKEVGGRIQKQDIDEKKHITLKVIYGRDRASNNSP